MPGFIYFARGICCRDGACRARPVAARQFRATRFAMTHPDSDPVTPAGEASPKAGGTRFEAPTDPSESSALRRFGRRSRGWWRRIGGLPGLAAAVRDGALWIYRNRRRIGAGIRRAGEILVAILKIAARIGAVLAKMGEALARLDAEREGARKRTGGGPRRVARAGAGISRFGRKLDRFGRGMLPVAGGVEDIGEHLEDPDLGPLPPPLPAADKPQTQPPPKEIPAPSATAEPAPSRSSRKARSPSAKKSPKRRPATRRGRGRKQKQTARTATPPPTEKPVAPETRPSASDGAAAAATPPDTRAKTTGPQPKRTGPPTAAGDLPPALMARIKGLGGRPRAEAIQSVIQEICRHREWSTAAEVAALLGRHPSGLARRHLKPMADEGRLTLRFPDRPRHPQQAYAAPP